MRSHHIPNRLYSILRRTAHTSGWLVCAGVGCSLGLDGPTPSLSRGEPLAISPAIVCSQQRSTTLDIRGQHFSPVPRNVPDGPRLELPTFTLERSALLDGSEASRVTLEYSGDSEDAENGTALRWLSEKHMQATLDDQRVIDGSRGRLPAGVYDARVVNPNGREATAAAALAVVDKPSLAAQAELVLCESQSELVIEGSGFLRTAGSVPGLQVDGQDGAWTVTELSECTPLSVSGGDAAICSRARLSVTSQLELGTYEAELVNPEPAACQTEDKLRIRVVAGPQLEDSPIESLCVREQTRVLIVRGKGFLDVSGTLPSATLADKEATVVALEECDPETGALRSCKELQLELPAGNLGASGGATTLVVTNPAPASCRVSASVELREVLQKTGDEVKSCLER